MMVLFMCGGGMFLLAAYIGGYALLCLNRMEVWDWPPSSMGMYQNKLQSRYVSILFDETDSFDTVLYHVFRPGATIHALLLPQVVEGEDGSSLPQEFVYTLPSTRPTLVTELDLPVEWIEDEDEILIEEPAAP